MKSLFLIAAAFLVISSSNGFAQSARQIPVRATLLEFEGFTIEPNRKLIGETEFINKIKNAILLLKANSPEEYEEMQSVIAKIRATEHSGANYNEEVMTIDIARRTFDASLAWLTSVLAHETRHIKLYKDTGKKYGDAHLMADKQAALQVMIDEELECNRIQLAVLKKVGGTKFELDYLKSQKGDHFDIDKDGDYDWDDYKSRDW